MPIEGFRPSAPSVFETESDPVTIGHEQIEDLIAEARKQPNGRARLLLHGAREDSLHEMVIALPGASCDHPHINYKSGKSFTAVSGQFAVMCFSEDGSIITPVVLSAGPWPGAKLARLRRPTWHTIIPLEGDTVFVETIIGPFTGNFFAEWFPNKESPEREAAEQRLRKLAREEADRLTKGA